MNPFDASGGFGSPTSRPPFGAPDDGFGSPGLSTDQPKRVHSVRPVTVGIIRAFVFNDDKFTFDDSDIGQITVIGKASDVKTTNTRIEFLIDDGTGEPLEVRQFIDSDNEKDLARNKVEDGDLVRVNGTVRNFGGTVSIGSFRTRRNIPADELGCHKLAAAHSTYILKLMKMREKNEINTIRLNELLNDTGASIGGGVGMSTSSSHTNGGDYLNSSVQFGGLTPIQAQVKRVISECSDSAGMHTSDIIKALPSIPPQKIKDALHFLSSEGQAYAGISDEHFKVLD